MISVVFVCVFDMYLVIFDEEGRLNLIKPSMICPPLTFMTLLKFMY